MNYELHFDAGSSIPVEIVPNTDFPLLCAQGVFSENDQPLLDEIAYHKVRIGLVSKRVLTERWRLMRGKRCIGKNW